jgi:hypothetical protein
MNRSQLPKGILIDLDDTILDDSGGIVASWTAVGVNAAAPQPRVQADPLYETSDPTKRHSAGMDPGPPG